MAPARREVHQRARDGRGRADRHRCRAHHGVMQLAHGQCPDQDVRIAGRHGLAARGNVVGRLGHECDFGRVLALGGFIKMFVEAHAQRAVRAELFEHLPRLCVTGDVVLQFGALVADLGGVAENRRDTRVDHRCPEGAHAGHFQIVNEIARGEHRTAAAFLFSRRIHELDLHFGCWKRHAVELEITRFLHGAVRDRHMRDDGLADVCLPDSHDCGAVLRHTARVDQPVADPEGADRGGQVAAVA